MKTTTLSITLITLFLSFWGITWFFELGRFANETNIEEEIEVKQISNPRNLSSKQIRFMFPDPKTGEPLTAIADFHQDLSPDLLFCYLKNINDLSDVVCLFMGELVYDENGSVIGNRVYEKKME